MHSRLPIAVPPAHHETAGSYVARLAALHGLPLPELWDQVSRPRRPGSTSRVIAADRLAAVTGHPETRLTRAVIDLRRPEPDWLAYRHAPQPGCPRCTARHPCGPVLQLLAHHRYVCTRHQQWIGPIDPPAHPSPNLRHLPEITAAQRAHLRLLHRLGPAATYDAVLTGFLICAHRWDGEPAAADTDAWHQWRRRVDLLIPPGTEPDTFSASRLFAATYPEAVKIAALVGSLHWRRLAAGDPDAQRRFAAEIGIRLGHSGYRPKVSGDGIAHWIDQDCWRPPSLPTHTYNGTRAFGARTPKQIKQGDTERHDRSARWFSWTRAGGKTMLFHRHLAPVLVRDWSPRMDLFLGSIHASASTSQTTDVLPQPARDDHTDDTGPVIPDYVRRGPAPSDHLDTAVEPGTWPTPTQPRPTRTDRPIQPGEYPHKIPRHAPRRAPTYRKSS